VLSRDDRIAMPGHRRTHGIETGHPQAASDVPWRAHASFDAYQGHRQTKKRTARERREAGEEESDNGTETGNEQLHPASEGLRVLALTIIHK